VKAFLFPGQGSQRKGMGNELFSRYPDYMKIADEVLGYSIAQLCQEDPDNQLNQTAYTQPAIFVVSVLNYLELVNQEGEPEMAAGHSIGEYSALFAAKAMDFATGLRIVKKRAELMSAVRGGGLAAVIGLELNEVKERVIASGLPSIEIANFNSPTQIVVGAPIETLQQFVTYNQGQSGRIVMLRVSGAFHTSQMREVQAEFLEFLNTVTFAPPRFPVISNYTAGPHEPGTIANCLACHVANPVRWIECIEYMVQSGVDIFTEVGSSILTPMVNDIRIHMEQSESIISPSPVEALTLSLPVPEFCQGFGLSKPMIVSGSEYGAMGVELVSSLARQGVLSFLDTAGLSLEAIEAALATLNTELLGKYGVSLISSPEFYAHEEAVLALCQNYEVRYIELKGYTKPSAALLRYRLHVLDSDGKPLNRVFLYVTSTEGLSEFVRPLAELSATSDVTELQVTFPVVDAVCAATQPWRSNSVLETELLTRVRECCTATQAQLPWGKLWLGYSGQSITENNSIQTPLGLGTDFVSVSSIFLLSQEAVLQDSIKIALSEASPTSFQPVPDWVYPAFATTSLGCVLDEQIVDQAKTLQELYLKDTLQTSSLRALNKRLPDTATNLLTDSFIDTCEGMNKFEIRAAVKRKVRAGLYSKAIHCDGSFPLLGKWLEKHGHTLPVPAQQLAKLIYPDSHSFSLTH